MRASVRKPTPWITERTHIFLIYASQGLPDGSGQGCSLPTSLRVHPWQRQRGRCCFSQRIRQLAQPRVFLVLEPYDPIIPDHTEAAHLVLRAKVLIDHGEAACSFGLGEHACEDVRTKAWPPLVLGESTRGGPVGCAPEPLHGRRCGIWC